MNTREARAAALQEKLRQQARVEARAWLIAGLVVVILSVIAH